MLVEKISNGLGLASKIVSYFKESFLSNKSVNNESVLNGLKLQNVNGGEKGFKMFQKVMTSLPSFVLDFLIQNPIRFEFVSESPYIYEDCYGVYVSDFQKGTRIIMLESTSFDELKRDTLHEIGHYFDATIGQKFINLDNVDWSDYESYMLAGGDVLATFFDPKLESIYKEERIYFVGDSHIYNSIAEFFAESFMEYYIYPYTFSEECPKMYQYIKEYESKFS